MLDLGSSAARLVGSSPTTRTSSSQAAYRLRRAFSFHCKAHRALILLLLAFAKSHARLACSVASSLTTARCRYQLFARYRPVDDCFSFLAEISVLTAFCMSEQSPLCSDVFMSAAKRCHPLTPLSPERPPLHISVSRPPASKAFLLYPTEILFIFIVLSGRRTRSRLSPAILKKEPRLQKSQFPLARSR